MTRRGKPAAVLVNYAEYERLKETLDVLSDPELMKQIRQSRRFYAAGAKGLSFEDVFGEPLIQPKRRARLWPPFGRISHPMWARSSAIYLLRSNAASRLRFVRSVAILLWASPSWGTWRVCGSIASGDSASCTPSTDVTGSSGSLRWAMGARSLRR